MFEGGQNGQKMAKIAILLLMFLHRNKMKSEILQNVAFLVHPIVDLSALTIGYVKQNSIHLYDWLVDNITKDLAVELPTEKKE